MNDDDEPIYERVGDEPMEDVALDAAIAAWRADHLDADELQVRGAELRLRRLNAGASERANERGEAEAAGVALWALQEAKAERRERIRREQEQHDLAAARRVVNQASGGGPTLGLGLDIVQVRHELVGWRGEWPPPQPTFCDLALGGITDRRLRQVLSDAETTWNAERRLAEITRGGSTTSG